MARTRLLHPGFFRNEALAELPAFARLLFAGLWTIADRAGRLEDRPKQIKLDVFPWDDVDVPDLLDQLASKSLICRYTVAGKCYLQVIEFAKYQKPHIREKDSVIPESPCKAGAEHQPRSGAARPRLPVSVSDPVSDPVSDSRTKEQRREAPPSAPNENTKVITRIAHEAMDLVGANASDLSEAVKTLCAQRHIAYDSATVGRAIDSARVQRQRVSA